MTDDRYAHYDRAYYIGRACPESQSYDKRILRPGDMGAALCYAFGIDSYAEVCRVLGIPPENPRSFSDLDFFIQIQNVRDNGRRWPKHILEVGCGRGELAMAFHLIGIAYCGIEPSPDAYMLIAETYELFMPKKARDFLGLVTVYRRGLLEHLTFGGTDHILARVYDTIIFCESIEHIPEPEFAAAWPLMVDMLRRTNGRLIITNWIDYHPIQPDGTGWDHVRLVDDAFYDSLAKDASRTVFRQGSHLVFEF